MKGFLAIVMILSALAAQAQTTGDYRSKATGNWSDTTVWERFDGTGWQATSRYPSSSDGVIEIQAAHTITVTTPTTADQILVDAGGTLSVTAPFSLLNGSGDDIICNGLFELSGAIGGSGATCSVNGVMNWSGGTCGITLAVRPGGTLNLVSALLKTLSAPLANAGTINWNAGSFTPGTSTVSNTGTFNMATTATLASFGTAGTLNNTGTFNLLPGITFTNNINFNNSGTISMPAGTAFTNTRTLVLNAGTVISGSGSFGWAGLESVKSYLDIPASIVLNITAGNVTSDAPFNIPGVMNWSGGTISSQLFLAASAILNLSGSRMVLSGNITSSALVKWTAGAIDLDGGTFTNYGTFQTDFDGTMSIINFHTGAFNNFGSFRKTGGSGSSTLGVYCTNTGRVNIDSGMLMNTGTIVHTGVVTISSGTKFINAGTLTVNDAGTIGGSGSFESRNSLVVNNYLDIPASLTFTNAGHMVTQGSTLAINGTMYMTGGTIENATFSAGAVINISAGQGAWLNGKIYNYGTINWSDGYLGIGRLFYNRGVINTTADATMSAGSEFDTITNSGTINKLQGSNTTIVGNFYNTGTININDGKLTLSTKMFNSGTITIPANGTMETVGDIFFNNGTVITGSGSINFRGDETMNTPLNIPASLTLSKMGGITLGKSPTTINGLMYWTDGNLQSPFNIAKEATLVINGSPNLLVLGDTLRNLGSISWLQGSIEIYRAPIYNEGLFSCLTNSLTQMFTYDTVSRFTNSGMFLKDSAVSLIGIDMPFLNTGLVRGKGAINFFKRFINRGLVETGPSISNLDLNIYYPTPIQFDSAGSLKIKVFNNSGAGKGNDLVNARIMALYGNLAVTETGTPPAGTYTILSASDSITGTFSSLSLPPGYTVSYTPKTVLLTKQAVLPLALLSFKAMSEESAVSLQWNTSIEYNTDKFVVERSHDGTGFASIGSVAAKGDSLHSTGYAFVDRQPANGLNYYRLKMLDKDGQFTYSSIVSVNLGSVNFRPAIYPNPVRTQLTVGGLTSGQAQTIRLVDQAGHTVYSKTTSANKLYIDMSRQSSGIYWLVIIGEGRLKSTTKIIKE
ncbi:MAG: T9SS type A sorting domain-containing protein [Williamsia sp.]|nr:T9SS type A sorting domain-containing protein [Williamsia sp.]